MDIKGKQIKCVSNFQAPELVVGKVYTASEVRTNPNGIWQVEVGGKWYAQNRFELAKENEVVKQQFYVGDVVEVVETEESNWYKIGDKFVVNGWNDGREASPSDLPHVTIEGEGKGVWVMAKHLKILSRAWQKNTGKQPVEYDVEVEVKLRCAGEDKCIAGEFRWDFEDCSGDIVEWRLADSVQSTEEQPNGSVPPSHVAVGEEFVATDESEEQKKKHSHYFKKCGYEHVDVYRTIKIFNVTDPCLQHAVKKLLVTGGRGFKDIETDVQDVIDTLERWKEMLDEDRKRGD